MKNKIKIAHIVTRLEYGGVESVILNYVKNMSAKDSFEFHIITQDINNKGCVELFIQNGFIVHIITHKRKSILKNINELFQIFRKEQFDIVHTHMNLTNFYALLLAYTSGTKIGISHVHSALIPHSFSQRIYYCLMTKINQLCTKNYIACGKLAGEFYFGKQKMENHKVEIFNNAINVEKFKYDSSVRNLIRKEYAIDDNSFVIGHIGRFMEVKNHKYLINIFKEIYEKHNDSKLLLLGDGELRQDIEKLVNKLNLKENVIFVGSSNAPENYYQAMDIFVLPSLYEGIPVVSIEAQCSGLPCIMSNEIDNTCKITKNVEFLDINIPAAYWADKILEYKTFARDIDAKLEVEKNGFSIIRESNRLSKYYLNLAKKGKCNV